jgi:hypothetical protein
MKQKSLSAALTLLLLLSAAASALTGDPIKDGKKITACILRLIDLIAPPICLAFMLIGGITFISATDDQKQRIMGKKYCMMGLAGIICIKALVGIAAMAPFDVTVAMCVHT